MRAPPRRIPTTNAFDLKRSFLRWGGVNANVRPKSAGFLKKICKDRQNNIVERKLEQRGFQFRVEERVHGNQRSHAIIVNLNSSSSAIIAPDAASANMQGLPNPDAASRNNFSSVKSAQPEEEKVQHLQTPPDALEGTDEKALSMSGPVPEAISQEALEKLDLRQANPPGTEQSVRELYGVERSRGAGTGRGPNEDRSHERLPDSNVVSSFSSATPDNRNEVKVISARFERSRPGGMQAYQEGRMPRQRLFVGAGGGGKASRSGIGTRGGLSDSREGREGLLSHQDESLLEFDGPPPGKVVNFSFVNVPDYGAMQKDRKQALRNRQH